MNLHLISKRKPITSIVKKINNVIYEIKNSDNGNTKDVVLYMQKSIASIKSLKK